jgi:hypothetical protein
MCICETVGTRKPLKLTVIYQDSTFHCFYALNFRQSPSRIEICRNQVHTNASNIFGLQPLAYHVYLWSSRHPTTAQTHGYIAGSIFHCFYALNFRQSPSMIEICPNQVHTGTPHIFCLTTTSIPCVFAKE